MGDGLANRAWRAVKGAAAAVAGSSNTRAVVNAALALAQRLDIRHAESVRTGIAISQGPSTLRLAQTPALALSQRSEGTPLVTSKPALVLSQRLAMASSVPTVPAVNLTQVTYDLAHRRGAVTAANIGSFAWSNPANAQGPDNATVATMAGSVTAARDGTLRFDFADFAGKSELAISKVTLRFYVSSSGTALENGLLQLAYRHDGGLTLAGATIVETITGNVVLGARSFDITAAIAGQWSRLDNLTAFVRGQTDAAESLINYSVDAVVLEVAASVTDLL